MKKFILAGVLLLSAGCTKEIPAMIPSSSMSNPLEETDFENNTEEKRFPTLVIDTVATLIQDTLYINI